MACKIIKYYFLILFIEFIFQAKQLVQIEPTAFKCLIIKDIN
jgi:hypothetical protein